MQLEISLIDKNRLKIRFRLIIVHHLCCTKKLQQTKSARYCVSCDFLLPYLVVCALRGIFEFRSCILTCFSKNRT